MNFEHYFYIPNICLCFLTFSITFPKFALFISLKNSLLKSFFALLIVFIDSTRFMANSLSNLVNSLSGGIHKIKCKYGHDDKKRKACRNTYKICDYFSEYTILKVI